MSEVQHGSSESGREDPRWGDSTRHLAPDDLVAVARQCLLSLQPVAATNWDRPTGTLEWSCRQTLRHLCTTLHVYSAQLATRTTDAMPASALVVTPDSSIDQLLATMRIEAVILAEVARAAPAEARAFHPAGMADRTGWLAMAIDELVIHTGDISRGLGVQAFAAPDEIVRRLLNRLFPWWPAGTEPLQALLWANGRTSLPDQPSPGASWLWHCAPLEEWDGRIPRWDPAGRRPI